VISLAEIQIGIKRLESWTTWFQCPAVNPWNNCGCVLPQLLFQSLLRPQKIHRRLYIRICRL